VITDSGRNEGRILNRIHFPNNKAAVSVFGDAAVAYGILINDIGHKLFQETYKFEAIEEFNLASDKNKRRVYWEEMLGRAHLSSVASIVRATAWIDCAAREYEAGNLYGWAAACRSLIEAAGDTMNSLSRAPFALAKNHHLIRANLNGTGNIVLQSAELEDDLIHFTHGRKIEKGVNAPKSHKAKQSWEYVKLVENMKIIGVAQLYSELCEFVHPAAGSVLSMITETEDSWMIVPTNQNELLISLVAEKRRVLSEILWAAFNPPLLTLRVLHKFAIFSHIDALKKYNFDTIADWSKINAALRS
jgi:hypothetical protein